jgi:hypothetical protein
MSPFRVGCAVEPSQLGQCQTATRHWIVLIVFPSRNPTQGRGSRQMVLIHRKPPPKREDNMPWIAPAADSNPSLEGRTNDASKPQMKKMSPGAMAHVQRQWGRSEPAPPGDAAYCVHRSLQVVQRDHLPLPAPSERSRTSRLLLSALDLPHTHVALFSSMSSAGLAFR